MSLRNVLHVIPLSSYGHRRCHLSCGSQPLPFPVSLTVPLSLGTLSTSQAQFQAPVIDVPHPVTRWPSSGPSENPRVREPSILVIYKSVAKHPNTQCLKTSMIFLFLTIWAYNRGVLSAGLTRGHSAAGSPGPGRAPGSCIWQLMLARSTASGSLPHVLSPPLSETGFLSWWPRGSIPREWKAKSSRSPKAQAPELTERLFHHIAVVKVMSHRPAQ